jgi:hypothetical protein
VHPYFFTGFLAEPGPAAQALLAAAAISRARYHVAASTIQMLRDPVVTSNADRLRFESFSACCGVHARLDLPPEALEAAPVTSGTTNVDFNPPMRAALAGAVATASQIRRSRRSPSRAASLSARSSCPPAGSRASARCPRCTRGCGWWPS